MDNSLIIVSAVAFSCGVVLTTIIALIKINSQLKKYKSSEGFLEQERRINETLKTENKQLHSQKELARQEFEDRIKELHRRMKRMDEDIILLQKSNEETEELLKAGMPVVHNLKIQLIEAQNTIARFKARTGIKEINETKTG